MDDLGTQLAEKLAGKYEGGWRETFNHLPAAWAVQACRSIALLACGAEVRFIDGKYWSSYTADEPGLIVAFTDELKICATITGPPQNYRQSGCVVEATGRQNLQALRVPESTYYDGSEGWPEVGGVVASYPTGDIQLPLGQNPTKTHLSSLSEFLPSLLHDLER